MSRALFGSVCLGLLGFFVAAGCEESAPGDAATGGAGGETAGTGGSAGEGPSTGGLGGSLGSGGAVVAPNYPATLRETGLYAGDGETLAEGVREYVPRFQLFSDGATKRRFVLLPSGTQIDTSDADYWIFPVGTKFWKEFSRDGIRIETRYLEKRANGRYTRISYHWNEDQSDAVAVPDGVLDASGTDHDVPTRQQCADCHGQTEGEILGFSALQLAYESDMLDAADLVADDLVSDSIATSLELPGNEQDRAALGYLHVNCGTCHNPTSSIQARVDMDLRLRVGSLDSVASTPTYLSSVGVAISVNDGAQPEATVRVAAGSSEESAVYLRMNSRGETYSMPPLGSELVDAVGSSLVRDWIDSLPETP